MSGTALATPNNECEVLLPLAFVNLGVTGLVMLVYSVG